VDRVPPLGVGAATACRQREAGEAEAASGGGKPIHALGIPTCKPRVPDRYRTSFTLGTEPEPYTGLARLLERVRHWRATEVREGDEPVSSYHAREMAWCASFYLARFGDCRQRFPVSPNPGPPHPALRGAVPTNPLTNRLRRKRPENEKRLR